MREPNTVNSLLSDHPWCKKKRSLTREFLKQYLTEKQNCQCIYKVVAYAKWSLKRTVIKREFTVYGLVHHKSLVAQWLENLTGERKVIHVGSFRRGLRLFLCSTLLA